MTEAAALAIVAGSVPHLCCPSVAKRQSAPWRHRRALPTAMTPPPSTAPPPGVPVACLCRWLAACERAASLPTPFYAPCRVWAWILPCRMTTMRTDPPALLLVSDRRRRELSRPYPPSPILKSPLEVRGDVNALLLPPTSRRCRVGCSSRTRQSGAAPRRCAGDVSRVTVAVAD